MKSDNMVLNDTKIYQKMKTKSLLSIEKNVIKRLIIIIRNYFFNEIMTRKVILMKIVRIF